MSSPKLTLFSRLEDGRIIDISPMRNGKWPLVLTPDGWVEFEGILGQINDSVPLTEEEAKELGLE